MLIWLLIVIQIIILCAAYATIARLFYIFTTLRNRVPYVPTPRGVIKKMVAASGLLSETSAQSREPCEIVDLGSGTGKMLFCLARYAPKHAALVGIEKSLLLFTIASARRMVSKHKHRITLIHGDWHDSNVRAARYVFLFLTRDALKSLREKFERELPHSAVIASYMFPLTSDRFSEEKTSWLKIPIYVYRKL